MRRRRSIRIPMPLADCPAGAVTGMGVVACTGGACAPCMLVPPTAHGHCGNARGAHVSPSPRRTVRRWLIRLVSASSCVQSCPSPPACRICRERNWLSIVPGARCAAFPSCPSADRLVSSVPHEHSLHTRDRLPAARLPSHASPGCRATGKSRAARRHRAVGKHLRRVLQKDRSV